MVALDLVTSGLATTAETVWKVLLIQTMIIYITVSYKMEQLYT